MSEPTMPAAGGPLDPTQRAREMRERGVGRGVNVARRVEIIAASCGAMPPEEPMPSAEVREFLLTTAERAGWTRAVFLAAEAAGEIVVEEVGHTMAAYRRSGGEEAGAPA